MMETRHIFLFHNSGAETQGRIPLRQSLLIFSTVAVNGCEKLSTNGKFLFRAYSVQGHIFLWKESFSWHLQPELFASFSLIHKIKSPVTFKWVANGLHCLCLIFMPGGECRPQHHGKMTFKIILCCSGNKHDAPGQSWESSGSTSESSLWQRE